MKEEKINIGDFTETITWQSPVAAKDSFGQTERTFSTHKTDRADIRPGVVAEEAGGSRIQYSETYVFTTHNDTAIDNTYQIVYNGDTFDIKRIERMNLGRFMKTTAQKIIS